MGLWSQEFAASMRLLLEQRLVQARRETDAARRKVSLLGKEEGTDLASLLTAFEHAMISLSSAFGLETCCDVPQWKN